MREALQNFGAGVVGTLAVFGGGGLIAYVMVSILEFFRPMLGVFGALAAFATLAAIAVGVTCFSVTFAKMIQTDE